MNRDEIMNMQPGRKMDWEIRYNVFNIATDAYDSYGELWTQQYTPVPHYSTSISAAWEVFERLLEKHPDTTLTHPWCVVANYDTSDWCRWQIKAEGDTAPEAICKAALLSLIQEDTP